MLRAGCTRCGQCGCVCGKLPYTLTVTFSGLVNRTHSQHCELSFTSNFGCGAEGVGISPGGCGEGEELWCGDNSTGQLSAVLLTDGGHDYARTGYREPVLVISGGSGSDATFTPTLEPIDDTLAVQCRTYRIASVAVSGGTGYADGDTLTVTPDGRVVTPAVLTLATAYGEPTVTATAPSGTGASLAVVVSPSGQTWQVSSVTVNDGGTGYIDEDRDATPVTFSTTGTEESPAAAFVRTHISQPTEFVMGGTAGGSGAVITPTLTQITGADGRAAWSMTAATITASGSGYTAGERIEVGWIQFYEPKTTEGYVAYPASVEIQSVDGNGGITAVTIVAWEEWADVGGVYRQYDDSIESIRVTDGGSYYDASSVPESVSVVDPGEYYTEDETAPPCVATVTVSADSCGGSGAVITPTIGDDPTDLATWGKVTGLTVDNGGTSDYLCWHWVCKQHSLINGDPIVLVAVNPIKLVTLELQSNFGSGACLRVVPAGEGTDCTPPVAAAYDGQPGPIRQVEVVSAGSGYARQTQAGVEVASVTVTVIQLTPSNGSGAAIAVTIGSNPANQAEFGKVLSASIVSGGSGYTILGAPQGCTYSSEPCGIYSGLSVQLLLRGPGEQPEIVLTDNRSTPGNATVLRCASAVGDCDSLPASASLLYGAPSGVTATIARGGLVETYCEDAKPEWCAICECPFTAFATPGGTVVDDFTGTPVSFTSGYSLCESGSFDGEGIFDDDVAILPDGLVLHTTHLLSDCQLESGAFADTYIQIHCCESQCNDAGECIKKIGVLFRSYLPTGPQDDPFARDNTVEGLACTTAISFVDGKPSGTVTIPCEWYPNPYGVNPSPFDVTITFG